MSRAAVDLNRDTQVPQLSGSLDEPKVDATPMWFGSHGAFGWFHRPAGETARAVCILCPAVGHEQMWSHRAQRLLAERLCDDGLAVLRFDYPGAGHSMGDMAAQWPAGGLRAAVTDAVAVARSSGATKLVAVGIRLGATVLASIDPAELGADAVVLWDPCVSGRSFLRQQRAITMVALATPEDIAEGADSPLAGPADVAELPGFRYGVDARHDLESLDPFRAPRPLAPLVLLATPGKSVRDQRQILSSVGGVTLESEGTDGMFFESETPRATISAIADWVDHSLPRARVPIRVPGHVQSWTSESGVMEHIVGFGSLGLFGIAVEPANDNGQAPTVFLNSALEPCVGPGRLWVTLSRRLAEAGFRSALVDLSGLGDSPSHPGQESLQAFPAESTADLVDVARALDPAGDRGIVMVGLCSGALNALKAAKRMGPRARVCGVNLVLDWGADQPAPSDLHDNLLAPRRPWLSMVGWKPGFDRVRRSMPETGWRLLHLTGLQRSPAAGLVEALGSGARLDLVCGDVEERRFERRGGWIVRELVRRGQLTLTGIKRMDHGLLRTEPRRQAEDVLFGLLAGASEPS